MWQKLKEQLPAVIITLLAIGGGAYWLHTKTVAQMAASQQSEIAALREQTNAEMKASAEETRRQIDAVNTLLKDAIEKRAADAYMTDEEIAKLWSGNLLRVWREVDAVAARLQAEGGM